jgi:PhnB protein
MSLALAPYLNFEGTCEEAMNFYQTIFGGTVEMTRFGDMPMPGMQDHDANKIMHSTLTAVDLTFMASDSGSGPVTVGDSVTLSLAGDQANAEKLRGFFSGLSEGGKISMALAQVPWGAEFGMVTDKFGIHWMVNIEVAAA